MPLRLIEEERARRYIQELVKQDISLFSYEKENIIALIALKKEYAYILEFIIWSWYSFYIDNDGSF